MDLIDVTRGKLLSQKILKLEKGFAHGNFDLPDSLYPDTYQVRAYTKWMRNFSPDIFFSKNIRILEFYEKNEARNIPAGIDFQFFPEGGNLIHNVPSKLAFKAVDAAANGIECEGVILNTKGDTVSTLSTSYLGMGFCSFTPDVNQTYSAKITHKNVLVKELGLSKILDKGYNMMVDNLSNTKNIKIYIQKSAELSAEKLGVIVQVRGEIYYAGQVNTSQKMTLLSIPKAEIPAGTAQITIFSEKGMPICERLVYMHLNQQANIEVKTNKPFYAPRNRINLDIVATNADGKPFEGELSMAVTDAFQVKHNLDDEHILSYFMLSSDVSGKCRGLF